jgi:hypothetical protein
MRDLGRGFTTPGFATREHPNGLPTVSAAEPSFRLYGDLIPENHPQFIESEAVVRQKLDYIIRPGQTRLRESKGALALFQRVQLCWARKA